jgi:hypothetical protein
MTISTRRFFWRPSGCSFVAAGWLSPKPTVDFRAIAGFGNDDTAVGMADQDHGAFLRSDCAPGDGHVVGQGCRRILNDADVVASFFRML